MDEYIIYVPPDDDTLDVPEEQDVIEVPPSD